MCLFYTKQTKQTKNLGVRLRRTGLWTVDCGPCLGMPLDSLRPIARVRYRESRGSKPLSLCLEDK